MGLKINEIFFSIQGESSFAGRPCVFVRLSGCNLNCTYCDTPYAREEGAWMSIDDIYDRVVAYGFPLVEITGGEPLLQDQTPALVKHLLSKGLSVLMETNGSMNIELTDSACIRIVDIKCPSSGQSGFMDMDNLYRMTTKDELKFVLSDRGDYEFAKGVANSARQILPESTILFSSVSGKLDPSDLSAWILGDRLDVRLQIQLHKIIWPDTDRGV